MLMEILLPPWPFLASHMGGALWAPSEQYAFCQYRITQTKKDVKLGGILGQLSIASLAVTEQVLDYMKTAALCFGVAQARVPYNY
jgi:hypothetical protein